MWYDERGDGDPLVLLHPGGAGVDSRALAPNLEALSRLFRAYAPEQRAHGHTPDVEGPISYQDMAQDTIMFIDNFIGRPVHLLGCSDGAVVALMVALRRPDLVRRLVFAAGVFHRDGWEAGVLDGEPPVPGTSHGLLSEKPDLCNLLIADFLTKDPVQTFAPIRRASRTGWPRPTPT
jgi:pimeloyl-ACP methyl ester carboxylesterase